MPQLTITLPDTEMERLRAEAARQNLAPEALALDLLRRSMAPETDVSTSDRAASSERAARLERIRGELSGEYDDLFKRLAGRTGST